MVFSALVVEDDSDLRDSLVGILREAGHEIDEASDGVGALALLARRRYDVLITDIDMPRMTGLELAAAVRASEATRDMPVVFVTAYPEQAHMVANARVLSKPFSIRSLLALVEQALQERTAPCDCRHPACPACQPGV